jgi:FMN phosphatase YigB (HAD superfamily)
MALDQKIRSLFAGYLFRPEVHTIENTDVVYVSEMPFELQNLASRWLDAFPLDRRRKGPRGLAFTVEGWNEMTRWMLLQLADAVRQLPMDNSGEIRAVVFDAFGTLCRIRDRRNPYARLLKNHGDRQYDARRLVLTQPLTLREAAQRLDVFDENLIVHCEADLEAELASIELYPEVVNVLRAWKACGRKIAIASNLAAPYAQPLLRLLPFEPDVCAWSFKVGLVKPDVGFYQWVLQELGSNAAADRQRIVLWVGDSLINDHDGPKRGGMRSILIQREPLIRWPERHSSQPMMVLNQLPDPRQFCWLRNEKAEQP